MRCAGPWIMAAALAAGCGGGPPPGPEPLRVAAASDLQAALPVLVARFKLDTGLDVRPTIGASGQLAQQVRQGAPFDLFLAANRKFVEDLAAEGVIDPGSVRPYARGTLVLAVHKGSDPDEAIKGLADLAKPAVKKIALANPATAPYGAAGKQALERAGQWEAIKEKVVTAETVRQALQFVQSGNAEAGLVGRAIADVREVRAVPVDPALYDPIVQALGVVAKSGRRGDAGRFAEFLLGEAGQGILKDFGFRGAEAP
jgi:molybdate transport system substrate-binding protein